MNPLLHYNRNTPVAVLLVALTGVFLVLGGRCLLVTPRHPWWAILWLLLTALFGAAAWFWTTFRIRMF